MPRSAFATGSSKNIEAILRPSKLSSISSGKRSSGDASLKRQCRTMEGGIAFLIATSAARSLQMRPRVSNGSGVLILRSEIVLHDPVGNLLALCDTFDFVELPV